jgi:hypothetical protein
LPERSAGSGDWHFEGWRARVGALAKEVKNLLITQFRSLNQRPKVSPDVLRDRAGGNRLKIKT